MSGPVRGDDAVLQRVRRAVDRRAVTLQAAQDAYRELCDALACARAAGVSVNRLAGLTGMTKRGAKMAAAKGAAVAEGGDR